MAGVSALVLQLLQNPSSEWTCVAPVVASVQGMAYLLMMQAEYVGPAWYELGVAPTLGAVREWFERNPNAYDLCVMPGIRLRVADSYDDEVAVEVEADYAAFETPVEVEYEDGHCEVLVSMSHAMMECGDELGHWPLGTSMKSVDEELLLEQLGRVVQQSAFDDVLQSCDSVATREKSDVGLHQLDDDKEQSGELLRGEVALSCESCEPKDGYTTLRPGILETRREVKCPDQPDSSVDVRGVRTDSETDTLGCGPDDGSEDEDLEFDANDELGTREPGLGVYKPDGYCYQVAAPVEYRPDLRLSLGQYPPVESVVKSFDSLGLVPKADIVRVDDYTIHLVESSNECRLDQFVDSCRVGGRAVTCSAGQSVMRRLRTFAMNEWQVLVIGFNYAPPEDCLNTTCIVVPSGKTLFLPVGATVLSAAGNFTVHTRPAVVICEALHVYVRSCVKGCSNCFEVAYCALDRSFRVMYYDYHVLYGTDSELALTGDPMCMVRSSILHDGGLEECGLLTVRSEVIGVDARRRQAVLPYIGGSDLPLTYRDRAKLVAVDLRSDSGQAVISLVVGTMDMVLRESVDKISPVSVATSDRGVRVLVRVISGSGVKLKLDVQYLESVEGYHGALSSDDEEY